MMMGRLVNNLFCKPSRDLRVWGLWWAYISEDPLSIWVKKFSVMGQGWNHKPRASKMALFPSYHTRRYTILFTCVDCWGTLKSYACVCFYLEATLASRQIKKSGNKVWQWYLTNPKLWLNHQQFYYAVSHVVFQSHPSEWQYHLICLHLFLFFLYVIW